MCRPVMPNLRPGSSSAGLILKPKLVAQEFKVSQGQGSDVNIRDAASVQSSILGFPGLPKSGVEPSGSHLEL